VTRFKHKELSFGFVILLPEFNPGALQGTMRSIRNRYPKDFPVVCTTGKDTTAAELKEIKEYCPAHRGKHTITSLINTGIKKGNKEWNIIIMAGAIVRPSLDRRYSYWIESEKDVLYPIVVDYNRDGYPIKIYTEFYEATLNGLCIHHKTFKSVGDMSNDAFEWSRKIWALDAAKQGVKFKAILGTKMC
jgi:hypothetical protein